MSTPLEGTNEGPNHGHSPPEWRDSPQPVSEDLNAILNDPKATGRQEWIDVLREEIADVQKRYAE